MNKNTQTILGILLVGVIAVGAWAMLNQPDDRTVGQKIEDAGNKLGDGLDDAARELEDRTPLERMEDDYEDATDGDAN